MSSLTGLEVWLRSLAFGGHHPAASGLKVISSDKFQGGPTLNVDCIPDFLARLAAYVARMPCSCAFQPAILRIQLAIEGCKMFESLFEAVQTMTETKTEIKVENDSKYLVRLNLDHNLL